MRYSHKRRRSHKRRSSRRVTHRRRRRVGAMSLTSTNSLVKLAAVAGGWFLEGTISPMLDKIPGFSSLDEKIKGVAEAGIGTALLMGKLTKKRAPGMLATVGGGVLAGAGLKRALRAFGVVSGYGLVPVVGAYTPNVSLNGYQKVPTIGAYATAQVPINGIGRPAHSKVMGSVEPGSGSGRMSNGSECLG